MAHVKITAPSKSAMGTEIEIDGVKAQEVRACYVRLEVDNVVSVTIEQFPSGIEYEGEDTEVKRIVLIDGKRYLVVEEVGT